MRPSVVATCSSQATFWPFRSRHVYTLISYQGGCHRSAAAPDLEFRLWTAGAPLADTRRTP
jgi:hypothetical protein